MPVYKSIAPNIRESHTAERLQVLLKNSGEDVSNMRPEVYFEIQIEQLLGEETVPLGQPYFDNTPLILDPSQDQELANAIELIQLKIGLARHAQLHAPPPEPEPDPLVQG